MNKIWIKVVLVISLDGKIALPNGKKSDLGGIGDKKVLEESLAWADATLMGSNTLRKHQSTCLIYKEELINQRIKNKRSKQPICIVISNRINHNLNWPFFKQPIKRWLISSASKEKNLFNPKYYENIIHTKDNWSETMSELFNAGLKKIVVLGGAELIGSLLIENQIDELQLTITPKILGGNYSWVPHNLKDLPIELSQPNTWLLKETKTLEENELMLRYHKNKC